MHPQTPKASVPKFNVHDLYSEIVDSAQGFIQMALKKKKVHSDVEFRVWNDVKEWSLGHGSNASPCDS